MSDKYKKALRLEYFTVGYNVVEAAASIIAGALAGSVALVSFGLDSVVESLSGLVLVWRLKHHEPDNPEQEERIEKRAVFMVGLTFIILGLYVLYESVIKIVNREAAETSIPGIIIAILSIIIMPILAMKKKRLGEEMGLHSLIADSKETLACSFLSVALLAGLTARALFDFTLADPIVGLIIVIFLLKEGWELLFERGEDD